MTIVSVTGHHTHRAILFRQPDVTRTELLFRQPDVRAIVPAARFHSCRARVPEAGHCMKKELFLVAIGTGTAARTAVIHSSHPVMMDQPVFTRQLQDTLSTPPRTVWHWLFSFLNSL